MKGFLITTETEVSEVSNEVGEHNRTEPFWVGDRKRYTSGSCEMIKKTGIILFSELSSLTVKTKNHIRWERN